MKNIKNKICLLCFFLCIVLCACHKVEMDNNRVILPEKEEAYLEIYHNWCIQENAKKVALIYLDEDMVPELLILKEGEYRLYSYKDSCVKEIVLTDTEIKADSYGLKHDFEETQYLSVYWFEYVPHKGLVRIHSSLEGERYDYYLKYSDGSLITELEAKSKEYMWYTFDKKHEITNEEFTIQLYELGYDELIPCGYLYEDVETAYKNVARISNTKNILEDFVNGKTDALYYVENANGSSEYELVMRSYAEFFDDITDGDDVWGSVEYVDFDNDGEDELIIHGYAGASLFFDAIGDMVYLLLETGSTTDVATVAEINGKRVIERTDLTHSGRKSYRIMEFDACGCLIDYFHLHTEYTGDNYSSGDTFWYRNEKISMDEFETIINNIKN